MKLGYFGALTWAMKWLADQPSTLFLGQSVAYPGQRAHDTFKSVPMEKRIELPIAEDFSVGLCTGLSLQGFLPILFLPRWDFTIIAANQILNHLDKIPLLGDFHPKVIIRTAVGASRPIDPGPQHTNDYTQFFRRVCRTIRIEELNKAEDVILAYKRALAMPRSTIIVEKMELYGT